MERKSFSEFLNADVGTYFARAAPRFFPDMLWRLPTDKKEVFLTFDDGPTNHTGAYLDLLAEYDAKATFFLLGNQCRNYPGAARRLRDAGHSVGSHSMTHPDAWRTPRETVWKDLYRGTAVLEDTLGETVSRMRPPYGRFTSGMRAWCARTRQRLVMWDVVSGDFFPSVDPHRIAQRVVSNVRPGSIVVLHDNTRFNENTLPAARAILERLSRDGWTFSALV